jgi:DNA repair exonuclease SbcCD nuclease subunit
MKLNNIRKITLVGDLHLGIRNNSVEWLQIQKDFLLDFLLNEVDQDFDEDRDILILEGDIFHSRESINVRVHDEALKIFKELSDKFKRGVYIILGNHDVYYKDRNVVHSLKSIAQVAPNIKVFENPEVLSLNGTHNFLMLPWVEDTKRITELISDHKNICDYVICHADIKGVRFNRWTKVEHGVEVSDLYSYKRVYSGHIHIRQTLKNVLYTGTPYQMDRGDRDNTKGFYELLLTDSGITETFIENTASPVYKKFEIFEVLEWPLAKVMKEFENSFVDIMINTKFVNNFPVTRFLELLSKCSYRKIEFFTYLENSDESTETFDFDPEEPFNIVDIFKQYVKLQNYSRVQAVDIAKKFIELHQRVKNESNYV